MTNWPSDRTDGEQDVLSMALLNTAEWITAL